jgi:hypothetical protein
MNDADRANNNVGTVIYDSVDISPNYDNSTGDLYLDEKDTIEVPVPTQQNDGSINEPYQKRYFFSPLNLPYSLEQPHSYSSRLGPPAPGVQDKKGPRLNRYYDKLPTYYKLKNTMDQTLVFESRFESGNLRRVIKVTDTEYDLYLKNDYGTLGYTQWFYFRVQNMRKDKTYRFNIVNLMKPDSNYNMGMKPLVYSCKEAEQEEKGWYRDGFNIAYYQSSRKKKPANQTNAPNTSISTVSTASSVQGNLKGANDGYGPLYYALSFELKFKHDNDTCYLAHCYPYTYTDLCAFVNKQCTF